MEHNKCVCVQAVSGEYTSGPEGGAGPPRVPVRPCPELAEQWPHPDKTRTISSLPHQLIKLLLKLVPKLGLVTFKSNSVKA